MDAVEYFRWMSPLASRISTDISITRCAYQDLWEGLSQAEKDQVIDEAIIDPAVLLKYNSINPKNGGKVKPLSKFSWFTKSQMDLFDKTSKKDSLDKASSRKKGPAPEPPHQEISSSNTQPVSSSLQNTPATLQNIPTAPTQPLKVIVPSPVMAMRSKRILIASPPSEPNNLFGRLKNRQRSDDRQPLVSMESNVSVVRAKPNEPTVCPNTHPQARLAKPKTPPPPPPTTCVDSHSFVPIDDADSIPKTGFDFLDNW